MGRGGHGRGRGRGGQRTRGRGQGSSKGQSFSRKETSHLKQFGEKHPADEFKDFAPSKRFKTEPNRPSRNTFHKRFLQNNEDHSGESESEEEELTPYNELLSIFSGRKGNEPIQIVSESEEEEEEESENVEEKSEELSSDDEQDLKVTKLDKLSGNEENETNSEKSEEEQEEVDINLETEEMNIEEDLIEDDESVINEAEIDPEATDENIWKSGKGDPFLSHFEQELSDEIKTIISSTDKKPYEVTKEFDWPILGRFNYAGIKVHQNIEHDCLDSKQSFLSSLEESKVIKKPPKPPTEEPGCPTFDSLHIKTQLHLNIPMANQKCIDKEKCTGPLTPLQQELLSLASNYIDIYYPQRTQQNEEQIRMAYCIHVANHILNTRTRIVHHNAKMTNKVEVPLEYRDQGFVRSKVLILTPFKETALRIVKTLISVVLLNEKGTVQNKKRFVDEYSGETLFLPKTNPKPEDYMAMFSGNVDDNFKIGLAITKKSIKLYTGFYASDVIIASPLGLRMIVGAQGEKDRDYDFLSSIEILIMDEADVFLMQNWEHLLHLIHHLHLQPITTHGTDFGRIRPWALDNLTKYYCQTLIFSSLICPEHLALFSRHTRNYAGFVKIINPIISSHISQISVQIPQIFQQFSCSSVGEVSDLRFEYFVTKVLPNFKGRLMSHTLIFVSSYFDFVRLRNYFRKEEQSFVQICEYTKDKKIARARDLFFHGKNMFLLYTERAHFFRRFRLKGIGHIIFYQLPQYPHFYSELVNFLQEGFQNRRVRQRKNSSVNVVYCKYDVTRLASLVGTERANYMLSSDKPTHAFVTEK